MTIAPKWKQCDYCGGRLTPDHSCRRELETMGVLAVAAPADGLPKITGEVCEHRKDIGAGWCKECVIDLRAKAQELQEQIQQVESLLGVPDTRAKTLVRKVSVVLDRMQKEISIEHGGRKEAESALAAALEREKAGRLLLDALVIDGHLQQHAELAKQAGMGFVTVALPLKWIDTALSQGGKP